jgi:hypothetical protein
MFVQSDVHIASKSIEEKLVKEDCLMAFVDTFIHYYTYEGDGKGEGEGEGEEGRTPSDVEKGEDDNEGVKRVRKDMDGDVVVPRRTCAVSRRKRRDKVCVRHLCASDMKDVGLQIWMGMFAYVCMYVCML